MKTNLGARVEQLPLVLDLDFIYFIYGFSFLVLALATWVLTTDKNHHNFPWKWLGLFGFTHGLNEWCDMIAISFGSNVTFNVVRIFLLTISFLFLFEFGRKAVFQNEKRSLWAYCLLFALFIWSGFYGLVGLNAGARYFFALPGAILGSIALGNYKKGTILKIAGLILFLYGFSGGFIVPQNDFIIAKIFSHEFFWSYFRFPVQILRALCALSFSLIIVHYCLSTSGLSVAQNFSKRFLRFHYRIVLLFFIILFVGGWAAEYIGHLQQKEDVYHAQLDLNLEKNNLEHDIILNEKIVFQVAESLREKSKKNSDEVNAILDRAVDLIPNSVSYLLDKNGITFASSNRNSQNSFVGKDYSFRPYFKEALLGKKSHYVATGITSDIPGYYVSVPLKDNLDNIHGVVVIKKNLNEIVMRWQSVYSAAYLVDKNGFILEATKKEEKGRFLWPSTKEVLSFIKEQGQYKIVKTEPLFPKHYNSLSFLKKDQQNIFWIESESSRLQTSIIIFFSPTTMLKTRFIIIIVAGFFTIFLMAAYIFERRNLLGRLKTAQEDNRFQSMVLNLNEVIFRMDKAGKITYVSPVSLKLFGHTPDEMVGATFNYFVHKEDKYKWLEAFEKMLQGDSVDNLRLRVISKDGQIHYTSIYINQIIIDNTFVEMQAVLNDITKNILDEEEKRNLREKMFHTEKLTSVGTLAAGVAHEINNPLAIILAYIDVVRKNLKKEGISNQFVEESLKKQSEAVTRIVSIVKNLVTFSRPDTNDLSDVDIHKVIEDTIILCRLVYKNKGIIFTLDYQASEFLINGNTGKLQQVFMNIFNNAKDAIEELKGDEGGKIEISTRNENHKIIVEVRDDGPGIPAQLGNKIFDPFFTTKPPGKGTGLGLSIVNTLMANHGGSVTFENNEKSNGALVRLIFPLKN